MNQDLTDAMTFDAPVDRDTETTPSAGQLVQAACCVPTRVWLRVSEQLRGPVASFGMTKTPCARLFELVLHVAGVTERR